VNGSDVFVCDRFQAVFISPRIANFLTNVVAIDEFLRNYSDSRSFSFSIIYELMIGCSIVVDEKYLNIFEDVIEDLGNL
jgi:hypothetical protein